MTCELPGQSMYNGYKHSYKKEHLPRARLNLAVSKGQVKLGRGKAGILQIIIICFDFLDVHDVSMIGPAFLTREQQKSASVTQ